MIENVNVRIAERELKSFKKEYPDTFRDLVLTLPTKQNAIFEARFASHRPFRDIAGDRNYNTTKANYRHAMIKMMNKINPWVPEVS